MRGGDPKRERNSAWIDAGEVITIAFWCAIVAFLGLLVTRTSQQFSVESEQADRRDAVEVERLRTLIGQCERFKGVAVIEAEHFVRCETSSAEDETRSNAKPNDLSRRR